MVFKMSTKREKILQKLNPELLKITPKLSGDEGSFIDLNSSGFLEEGTKKLMMRFFKNQDLCEKNKRHLAESGEELMISSAKYNENNEICELISERLTLPFVNNDDSNLVEKPGRRLQKLQMELEEKMSAKWEKEYKKRIKQNKVNSASRVKCKKKYSNDDDEADDDDDDDDDEADDADDDDDDDDDDDEADDADDNDDDDDDDDDELNKNTTSKEGNKRGILKRLNREEKCDSSDDADVEFKNYEEKCTSVASAFNKEKTNDSFEDDNDNCIKDDEYESCSLIPAYQPGGGMLYGGSELTQCDEGLPQSLLSPSLKLSINDSSTSKAEFQSINEPTPKKSSSCPNGEVGSFLVKTKLFLENPNDSFDLSDAFEFCSGKFPGENCESNSGTQNVIEENLNIINEERESNILNEFGDVQIEKLGEANESQDLSPEKEVTKFRKNIIVFDDSEEENEEIVNDIHLNGPFETAPILISDDEDEIKIYNKIIKKKKIRKNLHFSDEEDATNDCEGKSENDQSDESGRSENEGEDDSEIEGDEDDQRSVHYDSEENEIINPKEFFEKEAELSGSEWSGDEDEKGLDEFDVEEGDADNIDDDQVRSQLEKIHIRRVLDDDAREVRLIQEILFEDGDLHSDGKRRDRKFKWKNLGAFDREDGEEGTRENGGNSSEDDGAEEEAFRKLRHEKELFLMTKQKDGDLSSDEEIVENFHAIKVTAVNTSVKITVNSENKIIDAKTITDCMEIPKTTGLVNSRGSFLTRNEEFLSRLAKATSGITDNVLGPKNSKNFVFATKSPEKINSDRNGVCKRQATDSESYSRREKKIKLLSPEIGRRPSILDLLV